MKTLMLIACTSLTTFGLAQPSFEWANGHGSSGIEQGIGVTTDLSNNVITTGRFTGTIDFDPGVGTSNISSNGNADIYIQKLDPSGAFDWALGFGGSGNDFGTAVVTDNAGNIYLAGYFENTVDFDPGVGTANHTSNGGDDIIILKLDQSGNYIWSKQMGGSSDDRALSIAVDASGNVYTTGFYRNTVDFDPGLGNTTLIANGSNEFYIHKMDSNGNFQWVKTIGDTNSELGYGIDTDQLGNVIAVGIYSGTVDFDPGTGTDMNTTVGLGDIFVLKLNSSGDYLWSNQFGSTGTEYASSIAIDQNNNICLTGSFENTIDFDPGLGTSNLTSNGNSDLFVLKLDPDGNFHWAHNFGSTDQDLRGAIATDASSNIYMAASFIGTVDFDPGPGIANYTSIGSFRDVCVLKLTASGTYGWVAHFGGTNEDRGNFIAIDGSYGIITTGNFEGTGDFDPTVGTSNLSPVGSVDFYVQKMSQCIPTTITPDVVTLNDLTDECTVSAPTSPTASGNCGDTFTGTPNVTFPISTQGTTVVTWTYDDGNGNTSTQTQNVIITDVTNPVPDIVTLSDITADCEVTSLTSPTASDNCAGSVNGTHNASLPITTQGTTVVTWTYDDGNGNTATQTQNVIINDVTDPVPDVTTLSEITADCEVTSLITPTATDNCAGSINGTHNASLPLTTSTTVTWTYDDGNGNTVTQDQLVTITPIDNGISVVDEITLTADASGLNYQWINCSDNSQISGATNQTYIASSNGSYAVIVDNGSCSDTSDCLVISTVGILSDTDGFIEIYPNPSSGDLFVSVGNNNGNQLTITLYNVMGQIISNETITVSLNSYQIGESLSKGIYFLNLNGTNIEQTTKIIVK